MAIVKRVMNNFLCAASSYSEIKLCEFHSHTQSGFKFVDNKLKIIICLGALLCFWNADCGTDIVFVRALFWHQLFATTAILYAEVGWNLQAFNPAPETQILCPILLYLSNLN